MPFRPTIHSLGWVAAPRGSDDRVVVELGGAPLLGVPHRGTFVPDPDWPTIVDPARDLRGEPKKPLSSREDIRRGAKGSKRVILSKNQWHGSERRGRRIGTPEFWPSTLQALVG
jgi:hypothetical protein